MMNSAFQSQAGSEMSQPDSHLLVRLRNTPLHDTPPGVVEDWAVSADECAGRIREIERKNPKLRRLARSDGAMRRAIIDGELRKPEFVEWRALIDLEYELRQKIDWYFNGVP